MKTLINVILDASGSMESKKDATISAFNEFITTQQLEKADEAFLTLTLFNTKAAVAYAERALADVPMLSLDSYRPGGNTALYDAIANTVRATETTTADRVLTVILTDGEENSSRETTQVQVKALIVSKEGLGNWTFAYLGVGPEQWVKEFAQQTLGVQAGNIAAYSGTKAGTVGAVREMSANTNRYRQSASRAASTFSGGRGYIPDVPPAQMPTPSQQTATPSDDDWADIERRAQAAAGSQK